MKPWRIVVVSAVVVALVGLALASVSAAEPIPRPAEGQLVRTPRPTPPGGTPVATPNAPELVAIAIGQLRESDGETATVDLHATKRNGEAGGNLRFFSDDGYYNGGVRTLTVENGIIRAAGAGGLLKPDGSRAAVAFEMQVTVSTKQTAIRIRGNGIDYTLQGVLDPGFVFTGTPGN